MPRPTSRAELLDAARDEHRRLTDLVDALDPGQRTGEFPVPGRDRCVRDVYGHLHAWHLMTLTWYRDGVAGRRPVLPAPGHTWRTLPALNEEIRRACQSVGLARATADLERTHAEVVAVATAHSDAELFTRGYYPWTGGTTLGSWLISATSSHDAWAWTTIRRAWRPARRPARGRG